MKIRSPAHLLIWSGRRKSCKEVLFHNDYDVIYPQTVVFKRKLLLFLPENPSCLGPISSQDKSYWYNYESSVRTLPRIDTFLRVLSRIPVVFIYAIAVTIIHVTWRPLSQLLEMMRLSAALALASQVSLSSQAEVLEQVHVLFRCVWSGSRSVIIFKVRLKRFRNRVTKSSWNSIWKAEKIHFAIWANSKKRI